MSLTHISLLDLSNNNYILFYLKKRVRTSSTFSVLRPIPYFDFFRQTLLRPLYFDQNCTSTCTSGPIRSPDLTECRTTENAEDIKMVQVEKRSN